MWCGRWNGWQSVAEMCKSAQDGGGLREMVEAMKGGQYLKKVGEVEAIGVWCGRWNGWQLVAETCKSAPDGGEVREFF